MLVLGDKPGRTGDFATVGDACTIADIATFGWVRKLIGFYQAGAGCRRPQIPAMTVSISAKVLAISCVWICTPN